MRHKTTFFCFTYLLLANPVAGKLETWNPFVSRENGRAINPDNEYYPHGYDPHEEDSEPATDSEYFGAETDYDELDRDDIGPDGAILDSLSAASHSCGVGSFIFRGRSAYPCRKQGDSFNESLHKWNNATLLGSDTLDRIASGFEVQAGNFPSFSQVAIKSGLGNFICGGTLISDRIVLTAAHCFGVGGRQTFKSGQAYLGGTRSYKGRQKINITRACVSPEFSYRNGSLMSNDFAVIILAQKAEFNQFVQPACRGTRIAPSPEAVCFQVGMGRSDKPTRRQDLYGLPVKRCPDGTETGDPHRAVCYTSFDRKYLGTACKGDSGGPLYCIDNCSGKMRQVVAAHVSEGDGNCIYKAKQLTWHADYYKIGENYETLVKNCANNIGALPRF